MSDECMLGAEQNKIQSLLQRVGGQNKYQFCLFLIFALKWFIAAMILFSLNFFYYVPEFECTKAEMADYQTCQKFVCSYNDQQFWYDHLKKPLKKSIALDYGVIMVCSQEWVSSLLQSMSYIGSLIGYLVMSHIADNYGRKKGEIIAWIICIFGQVMTLVSFNLVTVGIGSFFMGFGSNGAINIHYSFFKELVLGKTRQRMIIAIQLAFSVGISFISLLSYLMNDWKYILGIFILIPSLLALFVFKFVEETPEFTLKSGVGAFVQSFNRIAKINNRAQLQTSEVVQELATYSISRQESQVSFLDLFRYKSLRLIAIITGLINFSIEFIYDGTLLSLDKFGINVYFNQILVGLVEIFGALFGVYIVPKVQRKKFVTMAFLVITIITVAMGIQSLTYHHEQDTLNFHTIIEMVLIALLRFVISSLWGLLFVYVSELYPNEISSLSYGWISIAGTVGASISPYIRLATANMTMFVMAGLSALMAFLVRTLNETKGKAIRTRILQREKGQDDKERRSDKSSVISNNT